MEFSQLMLVNDGLTVEEQRFVVLHKEILFCGNTASEYAIKMASDLKEMRDSKAYKVAGFETFGSYTETALGIKERQAYNYITVLEKLPSSFLHSNAKIGISKLLLLSNLSEPDRQEIIETVSVEDVSVKELKERIAEQEDKIKQLSLDLSEKDKSIDQLKTSAKSSNDQFEVLKSSFDSKVKAQIAKVKAEKDALSAKINTLEDENEKLKSAPKTNDDEIAKLKKELAEKDLELARKEKEIVISSDHTLLEFKIEFNNFQTIVDKMLALLVDMNSDTKSNCIKAIKTVTGVFYE